MDILTDALNYLMQNKSDFLQALAVHLQLSLFSLLIGILLCVPLGILCAKKARLSTSIMGAVNSFRVIPSLAILVIMMPLLGNGFLPALVALTILSCPPIVINTFLGISNVSASVKESATGMGMSDRQRLFRVEIPLALPLIISGIRTAAVEVISSATLAAFIGGGGLGTFIVNGLGMYDFSIVMVGAVPVALLAIFSEITLALVERYLTKFNRVK